MTREAGDVSTRISKGWRLVGAFMGALTLSAGGLMLGSWLGWQTAEDLPTEAQARKLTQAVTSSSTIVEIERHDRLFYYQHELDPEFDPLRATFFGDDDYQAGSTTVILAASLTDGAGIATELRRTGWGVASVATNEIVAVDDGWRLRVALQGDRQSDFRAHFTYERLEPKGALFFAICGLIIGAAFGASIGLKFISNPHAPPARMSLLVMVISAVGVLALMPNTVVVFADLLARLGSASHEGFYPLWDFYMLWGARALSNAGALMLLTAAVLYGNRKGRIRRTFMAIGIRWSRGKAW